MRRTRLFHSVVIVGSGLLGTGCHGKRAASGPEDISNAPSDAGVVADARVDQPPPPPRIHAVTPEKLGEPPDPPRIHAVTPEKMGGVTP